MPLALYRSQSVPDAVLPQPTLSPPICALISRWVTSNHPSNQGGPADPNHQEATKREAPKNLARSGSLAALQPPYSLPLGWLQPKESRCSHQARADGLSAMVVSRDTGNKSREL